MRSRGGRVLRLALRLLLCAVFVFSAVAKLMAIDHFELYIFSYGLVPLNVAYVLARLCIGAELGLAAIVALGWWPRTARMLTVGLLLVFTLFLTYALLVGRTESCQCFGQALPMAPGVSLVKNAVLIVVALAAYHGAEPRKGKRWLAAVLCVAAAVVPFVVSVPDNWMFGPEETRFDSARLAVMIGDGGELGERQLDDGRQVVAFVTPGCQYCQLARQKLDAIFQRHGLDPARLAYVEPSDVGTAPFLEVTYGQRPLVMLLDSGRVVRTYHLRNINEREMARFVAGEGDCW